MLVGLVEALLTVLDVLTYVSWIADLWTWITSEPSRSARKQAKVNGESPPPRSRAHRAFIVITVSSLVLTTLLILKWLDKI